MLHFKTEKIVSDHDWDELVMKVYGRPYAFQQQDGCKNRGLFRFNVPDSAEDFINDSVPEKLNGEEMGVSFKAWMERDPAEPINNENEKWAIDLFWQRNFYPNIQMIANDLYARDLIEAGNYVIEIDW